jgi:translocation and assembly module TamB
MRGWKRVVGNVVLGLLGLVLLIVLTAVVVLQTQWFRNYVRDTIRSSVAKSTGGRVDIGAFNFDVWHLHATVSNFVIHGKEPTGAAPFVRVGKADLRIRLFTSVHRLYEIAYLGVDHPEVNIMVLADGDTNIPTPQQKTTSDKTALETVVDLAVGRFDLSNGLVQFESAKQPLNVRANNLHAQLLYSLATQGYEGQLAMEPLYVLNGRNTPVNFKVTLPLKIGRDRIDLQNAVLSTATSSVSINGSMRNMRNPEVEARVDGHISTPDIRNAANVPIPAAGRGVPSQLDLFANATVSNQVIRVSGLRVSFGQSHIEASGPLRDPGGTPNLQFKAELALREVALLAATQGKGSVTPSGVVRINGTAALDANNNYNVGGNVDGRDLAFTQGARRFSNVSLYSAFHADPQNLALNGLTLHAFGGQFVGNLALADFQRYQVDGRLANLDLAVAARAFGQNLPYDGVVSGPVKAQGDLKAPGMTGTAADIHLAIAPLSGRGAARGRGIPLSGRLNASYVGARDDVVVQDSFLALPHTRLTLAGSLKNRLNVALISRDLQDLLAAVPAKEPVPVVLENGEANFTGAVIGGLSSPRVTGHLAVSRFAVKERLFDSLLADLDASPARASIASGSLARGIMKASFDGDVALRNWSTTPDSAVSAHASVLNGDIADFAVLAGQPSTGYSGSVTANAQVTGTVGNPQGSATVEARAGQLHGEPFNLAQVQVNLADQLVTVPVAFIDSGAGRVNMTAEFRHPRDSFSTGQVRAHVQTDQLNAGQLHTVQQAQPGAAGTLRLNADVNGELAEKNGQSSFLLSSVNGDVSVRALRFEGQNYGDFNATARTNGKNVIYDVASDFAGSKIQVNGSTQLITDYPTHATGSIAGLPVERVLTLAKQAGVPARGLLSGTFTVNGTVTRPEGSAEFSLAHAVVYDEPLDQARLRVSYLNQSVDVPQLEIVSGPSRIALTAHYDHPVGDFTRGSGRLDIAGGHIDLGRLRTVQKARPGLTGVVDIKGNAAGTVRPEVPIILLSTLDADVSSGNLTANGKNVGQFKLVAHTTGGNAGEGSRVHFALDSNLAEASVHGSGDATLGGDYPVTAQLAFSNVAWTRVAALAGMGSEGAPDFEATTDGELRVNGPVLKTDQMSGSLALNHLSLTTLPRAATAKAITIANQGPVQIALDKGTIRVQNAHLTGPDTDLQASGTAAFPAGALNLNLQGNLDLTLMQKFDRDIYSAGKIDFSTVVRGTSAAPLVNGQLNLRNASMNYGTAPVGIANANGTVVFNGNNAQIRNMTAESGGGKLTLSGFAGFTNGVRFAVRAAASNVRLRVQQGVSLKADADVQLAGTTQSSRATGRVTINQLTYAPQSDIGSILTRAAPPVQSPSTPSPLLDNMQLDVRVQTASGTQVQASLAENLQFTADLRVHGTASEPAIQGRITINSGKLVFFGATYSVDTGTIAFYNPIRIEPILDISLVTQAKGVTVTLRVTGPVDNMKLSYTSDPPLQFQEIVGLLASGKAPTSDPTLLANQPQVPAQSYQQMGESAILGQAVANPVASRLQRVFGVSQLKIDPSFTTGSDVPTARLTLQQQISSNLTFTYVSALNDPNSTAIRIEWAFNPQWSAVATRDENGIFSVNFFYKREFK